MSITLPTVPPYYSNPKLDTSLIQSLQVDLDTNLGWLSRSYAEAKVGIDASKKLGYPQIGANDGTNTHYSVSPDSSIASYSFFEVDSPMSIDTDEQEVTASLSIVFWGNLDLIDGSKTYDYTNELYNDVVNLLTVNWAAENIEVETRPENIFDKYSMVTQEQKQMLLRPYTAFKVSFDITIPIHDTCDVEDLDTCTLNVARLNELPESVQQCISSAWCSGSTSPIDISLNSTLMVENTTTDQDINVHDSDGSDVGSKVSTNFVISDGSIVLKDTAGSAISTTAIKAQETKDVVAPDGSVRVEYENGTLIENVSVKSNGSETSQVPNPISIDIDLNGVEVVSGATTNQDIPVEYVNGSTVGSLVGGVWTIPNPIDTLTVDFTANDTNPDVDEEITFTATGDVGSGYLHIWEFGDGTNVVIPDVATVNHTYTSADTYDVHFHSIRESDHATGCKVRDDYIDVEVGYVGLLDEVPNAAFAAALRLLRAEYSGALVEIRRSSDNAVKSFYPDSAFELSMSSEDGSGTTLSSWIGSDDGFVRSLFDHSGNAKNALNTNASTQPQIISSGSFITDNGKPCMQFTSGDYLAITGTTSYLAGLSTGASSSIHAVFSVTTNESFPWMFGNSTGVTTTNGVTSRVITGTGRFDQFAAKTNTGNNRVLTNLTATSYFTNNAQSILQQYYDVDNATPADRGRIYLNDGSAVQNNTDSGAVSPDNPDADFHIGTTPGGNAFDGKYQEFVIYLEDKDAAQTDIRDNMNTYYSAY